jgi:hypothetical protein
MRQSVSRHGYTRDPPTSHHPVPRVNVGARVSDGDAQYERFGRGACKAGAASPAATRQDVERRQRGLVNLPLGSISTMPVLIADEITVAFILSRRQMRAIATCCVCQPISKRVAYGGGRERQAPTDNLARPGIRVKGIARRVPPRTAPRDSPNSLRESFHVGPPTWPPSSTKGRVVNLWGER